MPGGAVRAPSARTLWRAPMARGCRSAVRVHPASLSRQESRTAWKPLGAVASIGAWTASTHPPVRRRALHQPCEELTGMQGVVSEVPRGAHHSAQSWAHEATQVTQSPNTYLHTRFLGLGSKHNSRLSRSHFGSRLCLDDCRLLLDSLPTAESSDTEEATISSYSCAKDACVLLCHFATEVRRTDAVNDSQASLVKLAPSWGRPHHATPLSAQTCDCRGTIQLDTVVVFPSRALVVGGGLSWALGSFASEARLGLCCEARV